MFSPVFFVFSVRVAVLEHTRYAVRSHTGSNTTVSVPPSGNCDKSTQAVQPTTRSVGVNSEAYTLPPVAFVRDSQGSKVPATSATSSPSTSVQQTLAAHSTIPTSGQFTTAPLTCSTSLSTTTPVTTSAPTAVPVPEDTSIEVLDLGGENQDFDPDVSLLLDSVEEISAPDIEVLHESRVTPNVQTTIDLKSSRGGRPGLSRNSAVKSRNARDGTERLGSDSKTSGHGVNAPPVPVLGKVSLCFSLLSSVSNGLCFRQTWRSARQRSGFQTPWACHQASQGC